MGMRALHLVWLALAVYFSLGGPAAGERLGADVCTFSAHDAKVASFQTSNYVFIVADTYCDNQPSQVQYVCWPSRLDACNIAKEDRCATSRNPVTCRSQRAYLAIYDSDCDLVLGCEYMNTASPPAPPPPPPTRPAEPMVASTTPSSSSTNIGAIVGGVVAGVVLLAVVVFAIFFFGFWRKGNAAGGSNVAGVNGNVPPTLFKGTGYPVGGGTGYPVGGLPTDPYGWDSKGAHNFEAPGQASRMPVHVPAP